MITTKLVLTATTVLGIFELGWFITPGAMGRYWQMVVLIVMLCWLVFAAVFIFRKRPPKSKERKRDSSFVVGILLQGIGYAVVWSFQRTRFSSIIKMQPVPEMLLAIVTVCVAIGSVWIVMSAVKTLGKQWSIAARLVEDHRLITEGPYRFVRHPIYSGMFGMMLATGFALSHWAALIVAVIIFWFGTILRVRSEEALLRDAFGATYDEYSLNVPAVIPAIRARLWRPQ